MSEQLVHSPLAIQVPPREENHAIRLGDARPLRLTKAELEQWYACEPNPDQEAEEGPTIEGPAP